MALKKGIDYTEFQEEDSPMLTWKFTSRGKAKYDKFIYFTELWFEWLIKPEEEIQNKVDPMKMGIHD